MDWATLIPAQAVAVGGGDDATIPNRGGDKTPAKSGGDPHLCRGGNSININALHEKSPQSPLSPPQKAGLGLEEQEQAPGGAGRPVEIRARKGGVTGALTDDRRACSSCRNLEDRECRVARPGGVVSARRGYEPIADLLQRCRGYSPLPADPDQRRGIDRWPGV